MLEDAIGNAAVKKSEVYDRNLRFRDGHEAAGSFCRKRAEVAKNCHPRTK
jgi:hypothetical protein